MIKSFTASVMAGTAFASVMAALLLAPQQALAGNTVSQGGGVKLRSSW